MGRDYIQRQNNGHRSNHSVEKPILYAVTNAEPVPPPNEPDNRQQFATICPFNSTHVVSQNYLEDHVSNECPDARWRPGLVERKIQHF